jgi:hypothetical protein
MSGRSCSAATTVFFEAQPLASNKDPDRPAIRLDPARRKLADKLTGRERTLPEPFAQPIGDRAGQNRLLVTVHLAGLQRSVSRRSLRHFDKHDGLIDSASAIARSVSPASDRIRARARRSSE